MGSQHSPLSSPRVAIFLFLFLHSSLSLSNLFGGLKNKTGGGADNLIICTIRYAVHYTRVYDTVLVDKVGQLVSRTENCDNLITRSVIPSPQPTAREEEEGEGEARDAKLI